jgi:steroid 5-alpha reductase family enzyme
MCIAQFYLLKRKFGWDELGGVLFALFVYQVCFALLNNPTNTKINVLDVFSIALFVIGSYLNTGSELQRKKFKDNPNNQGLLYTEGLFRYARHVNYFGDILWVTAWAFMTRNIWSAIIPVVLTAAFIFFFIPSLAKYLRTRYGQQYDEWVKTTKVLIPFIY